MLPQGLANVSKRGTPVRITAFTAIIVSVIDNLVKGASGQAIQNLNLMFGFDEQMGLNAPALMP